MACKSLKCIDNFHWKGSAATADIGCLNFEGAVIDADADADADADVDVDTASGAAVFVDEVVTDTNGAGCLNFEGAVIDADADADVDVDVDTASGAAVFADEVVRDTNGAEYGEVNLPPSSFDRSWACTGGVKLFPISL